MISIKKTVCLIFAGITALVLTSCAFSNKEVAVYSASSAAQKEYFQNEFLNTDGMTLESENFLRGNMLYSTFSMDSRVVLQRLSEYYKISKDPKYMQIAADFCRHLARKAKHEDAIQYYLSSLYYFKQTIQALMTNSPISSERGWTSRLQYLQLISINNEACRGIFTYLKENNLLDSSGFTLTGIDGQVFEFEKPVYNLSIDKSYLKDLALCSDFTVKSLLQVNRKPGFGVPLIGYTHYKQKLKNLKTPYGLTIPVTALVHYRKAGTPNKLRMVFQDTFLSENISFESNSTKVQDMPLALDFSTPLGCFLDALPRKNLISVMLNPWEEEKSTGLYMLEPYRPDKIPVVFIHGLLSSPGTWIQMINSLRNDPVIRQKYQIWFFSYSSGTPIFMSAQTLRKTLVALQKELCTTPEATTNFNKMVLVGHSMGGMITRTMLQKNPYLFIEKYCGDKWENVSKKLKPEERQELLDYVYMPALPFVHRALFLAVPHRGSKMATWSIANLGIHLTKLPSHLLNTAHQITIKYEHIVKKESLRSKMKQEIYTGIDNLNPDNIFPQILGNSVMKDDLVYHSIIGNNERSDFPGGTDGVVEYSSSHLDGAKSELVVKSGHSVHRQPAAIREVMRILYIHLQENAKKK